MVNDKYKRRWFGSWIIDLALVSLMVLTVFFVLALELSETVLVPLLTSLSGLSGIVLALLTINITLLLQGASLDRKSREDVAAILKLSSIELLMAAFAPLLGLVTLLDAQKATDYAVISAALLVVNSVRLYWVLWTLVGSKHQADASNEAAARRGESQIPPRNYYPHGQTKHRGYPSDRKRRRRMPNVDPGVEPSGHKAKPASH